MTPFTFRYARYWHLTKRYGCGYYGNGFGDGHGLGYSYGYGPGGGHGYGNGRGYYK